MPGAPATAGRLPAVAEDEAPALGLFAYGSLVDPLSASLTLGREVGRVWPARLAGRRRRFSQVRDNRRCEKTFARAGDGTIPPYILGLNLEPDPETAAGSGPNGGLVAVSAAELLRLDRRELRYDRTELDPAALAASGPAFEQVFTYVAKPEHRAPRPPAGAVILAGYASTVERAFARLGPGERQTYLETTLPYPAEVVEGRLVADRIPEGNPRDW